MRQKRNYREKRGTTIKLYGSLFGNNNNKILFGAFRKKNPFDIFSYKTLKNRPIRQLSFMVGLERMVKFSRMGEKDIHHVSNLCKLSSGTRNSQESINVAAKWCSILLDAKVPAISTLALWNFSFTSIACCETSSPRGREKSIFRMHRAEESFRQCECTHFVSRCCFEIPSGMVQWSSVVVELKANPNYKLFFIQNGTSYVFLRSLEQ